MERMRREVGMNQKRESKEVKVKEKSKRRIMHLSTKLNYFHLFVAFLD